MRWRGVVAVILGVCVPACGLGRSGNLALDAGGPPDATAPPPPDARRPGLDATLNDGPANDSARGPAPDAAPNDGSILGAPDAPPCPAECNGGCGDSGLTCTIVVTSSPGAAIICPPGFACRVECTGTQVCDQTINCAGGQACTVVCNGDQACTSNTISAGGASSLCVECIAGGGNPGCDSVTCAAPSCTIACTGGCGSSCGACAVVASCP